MIAAEQKKKEDLLKKIRDTKSSIDELELQKKERWNEVKDFVPENDYYKVGRFDSWVKNTYNKQMSSLKSNLTKLTNQYDDM